MEPSSSGRPTRSLPEQRSSAEFPPNERVRCPCRDDGGGEIVRFFARLDLGTAFATLIRQRHPMPSCGELDRDLPEFPSPDCNAPSSSERLYGRATLAQPRFVRVSRPPTSWPPQP